MQNAIDMSQSTGMSFEQITRVMLSTVQFVRVDESKELFGQKLGD